MQLIYRIIFFLFIVGLFFDRSELILVFYSTTILYIIVSVFLNFKYLFNSKQPYIIKGFFLFTIFSAVSIFWSIEPQLSKDMTFRLFLILILLFITYYNNVKYDLFKTFVYALLAGLAINFIMLLFFNSYGIGESGRFSGTLSNSNSLSIIVIFSIFFYSLFTKLKTKSSSIFFLFVLMICFSLILSTGSRKGLLFGSLITVISILSFAKTNKKFYLYLLFLIPISIVSIIEYVDFSNILALERLQGTLDYLNTGEGDSSTKFRFIFIDLAYNTFLDNKFFGIGIDAFKHFTGIYAHNNYLEILADLGVIGFIIYYSIYFPILKNSVIQRKNLLFISMIITVLIMEYAVVNYYTRIFWIFMLFFSDQLEKQKSLG